MNKVAGLHHLAICTANMKEQIEFFTDKLGMELQALYWMHGVENTWHGFLRLNDESSIAFVCNPDIKGIQIQLGATHAGNPGANCAGGSMQHLAFKVSDHDEMMALRDRLRTKGVPVMGPVNHGMCVSMYFAGPENLSLELSYSSEPISAEAWIDPEVVALAGISAEELARYKQPASFEDQQGAVSQPALDGAGPHMTNYPPGAYEAIMSAPDAAMWDSLESEPPVKSERMKNPLPPPNEAQDFSGPPDAGNGLYGRRSFLRGTAAIGATLLSAAPAAALEREAWMKQPGAPMSGSGQPSVFESHVKRGPVASQPGTTGSGASRTPLQHLDGLITPSRLHFERHHSGIPNIDPGVHKLYVHGLVERPLAFDVDALSRYPMVSRIQFLECSGNSAAMLAPQAVQADCATIHGLISTSEWGGVPLSILLDEAGISPAGKWLIADGADAAVMSRSIPLEKILDDAIVALYQNGERLQPANGYPMRLFLPGWEGNASVKWLRSLKVTSAPSMTKDETSKYSDLGDAGQAKLFTFPMGVKSLITSPSPGSKLTHAGVYQISGMAWSGVGKIKRVEVSTDAGQSWTQALLDTHILSKCVTRFRAAWRWNGAPATILSRATDESGAVQPTRALVMQNRAVGSFYHVNAVQAWHVDAEGEASNRYV